MSCTICGKATGPGALLCRPCKAALKRARQFTVLEIPGTAPAVTMAGGLPVPPARAAAPTRARRRSRAPWRTLVAIVVVLLAATAGTLFAIQHVVRGGGSAGAAESLRPAATLPARREPAAAATADLAPLPIAPRTLVSSKPHARPSAAEPAPPASTPAPESPAVTASVTTPEIAMPTPAAAAAPSPPDRWQTMSDGLARCAREGGLGGFICDQRTRLEACEGFWGRVPQCPLPPENPR